LLEQVHKEEETHNTHKNSREVKRMGDSEQKFLGYSREENTGRGEEGW
jgi:hypothetical protein